MTDQPDLEGLDDEHVKRIQDMVDKWRKEVWGEKEGAPGEAP